MDHREDGDGVGHGSEAGATEQRVAHATATTVDDALGLLDTLRERPLEEHPDVFQEIHTRLHQALSDIDGS
jgi:hypothetical protein